MGTMARHTIAVLLQPGPLLHRAAIGEVDKVVGRVAHLLELSLYLAPGVGRARRLGDVGLELVLFQRLVELEQMALHNNRLQGEALLRLFGKTDRCFCRHLHRRLQRQQCLQLGALHRFRGGRVVVVAGRRVHGKRPPARCGGAHLGLERLGFRGEHLDRLDVLRRHGGPGGGRGGRSRQQGRRRRDDGEGVAARQAAPCR
mmetsp:Transcript_32806/g.77552  ORF Transcript_32806/g.77552 Transcript_32806/m.77552 type:complete len:201 (+) Transcript_32806:215-817(+)